MKTIYKAKSIIAASVLAIGLTSCADWLEVKMEDKVMENTLFANYKGYMTALNGVYLGMNDVYSSKLAMGPIDVMAQYYNVQVNNNHSLRLYATYAYSDNSVETGFNEILWNGMYNLLANTNVIIERTSDNCPLTEQQRALIRGEALALRAFFHFDLLRLYGPIYAEDPTKECIPYQLSSDRAIQPLLPAEKVMEYIFADLREAETLLEQYDPIITDGVGNVATEDNGVSSYDMSFRQLRMNYYAVQAMLARAYMWIGNKTDAYKIATEKILDRITTADLEVFPWTTKEAVEKTGKPDYLFSSEVMFSLYNTKRTDLFSQYFSSSLRTLSQRLTFYGQSMTDDSKIASFYDDDNDLRMKMWQVVEPLESEKQEAEGKGEEAPNTLALLKYSGFSYDASTDGTETYRYMIPLIRLSEIYLIAAECATDRSQAVGYINTIRDHRLCLPLKSEDVDFDRALTYEMAREVIGEGQLFFFYKRRGETSMIAGTKADGIYMMDKANYVMPLPDAELEKRLAD